MLGNILSSECSCKLITLRVFWHNATVQFTYFQPSKKPSSCKIIEVKDNLVRHCRLTLIIPRPIYIFVHIGNHFSAKKIQDYEIRVDIYERLKYPHTLVPIHIVNSLSYLKSSMRIWNLNGFSNTFSGPNLRHCTDLSATSVF